MRPVEPRVSLAQSAYQRLRLAIRERTLVQDVYYSENEVAKTLGMSRTPVREALVTLVREGLVEVVSQRGFRVRNLSESQFREVFELTAVVESYVARKFAAVATEDQIAQLRETIIRLEEVQDDPDALLTADEEFHALIPTLVGFERSHAMILDLRGMVWLVGSKALSLPERRAEVIAEHHAIVDAIAARDSARASQVSQDHIMNYFSVVHRPEL